MANLVPLVLWSEDALMVLRRPSDDSVFGVHAENLLAVADAHGFSRTSIEADPDRAERASQLLGPLPFDELMTWEPGREAYGIPVMSRDDARRFFDPNAERVEIDSGLPSGFAFWPVDPGGAMFGLIPSDPDPGTVTFMTVHVVAHDDTVRLEPALLDGDNVVAGRGAPPASPGSKHCTLDIHRNRPDVAHIGTCLDRADDPCPNADCYEVVETINGRAIAVRCGC